MKKLLTLIIILVVLIGGGYFGLKQYAPEILDKYVPQEILDKVEDLTDIIPSLPTTDEESDAEPLLENAEAFCIRQNGSVQECLWKHAESRTCT